MPQTHELEAWSDSAVRDGTASLVQPLIRPLFRSWTDHELLALLAGREDASPYDLVRETWRAAGWQRFRGLVERALHDGVIAGSRRRCRTGSPRLPDYCRQPRRTAYDAGAAARPACGTAALPIMRGCRSARSR